MKRYRKEETDSNVNSINQEDFTGKECGKRRRKNETENCQCFIGGDLI